MQRVLFLVSLMVFFFSHDSMAMQGGTRRTTSHSSGSRPSSSLGHTPYRRATATTPPPRTGTTRTPITKSGSTSTTPNKVYRPGITHSATVAEAERKKAATALAAKRAAEQKEADEAKKKAEQNAIKPMPGQKPKVVKPIGPIHSL